MDLCFTKRDQLSHAAYKIFTCSYHCHIKCWQRPRESSLNKHKIHPALINLRSCLLTVKTTLVGTSLTTKVMLKQLSMESYNNTIEFKVQKLWYGDFE